MSGRQARSGDAATAIAHHARRPIRRPYPPPPAPRVSSVDARAALRTSPATTALFVDFDGTLAPIVGRAEDARPLPEVPELLLDLRRRFGVAAIVSGRPVAYLAGLRAAGGGAPRPLRVGGAWSTARSIYPPGALDWRTVVDEVADAAHADAPEGVDIEHKGLSLTLHFRRRPEAADRAQVWAISAAERSGLHLRPAKMSVELHPPLAGRQGHGGRGAGRGDDGGRLHRRRPRRPARLRRPRPAGGARRHHREGRGPHAGRVARRCSRRPTCWSTARKGPSRSSARCSQRAAASWSASQSRGRPRLGEGAELAGPLGALGGRHGERLVQHRGGAGDVERRHAQRGRVEALPGSRLRGQREHGVAVVHQRQLRRHEVEPVADRVHEEHVGTPQEGHRGAGGRRPPRARSAASRRCPTAR